MEEGELENIITNFRKNIKMERTGDSIQNLFY